MAFGNLFSRGAPPLSKFFLFNVWLILLLSAAVFGLAIYAERLTGHYYYDSSVPEFLIFVSIWTWLVHFIPLLLHRFAAPRFYLRIAILVGQVIGAIFWIAGFGWAASWAAYTLSFDNYNAYDDIRGAWKAFGQIVAAAAGVGALVWVLCLVALVMFYVACADTPPPTLSTARDVELAEENKSEGTVRQ